MIFLQAVTDNKRSTGWALNVSWGCVQFILPSHQYLQASLAGVVPEGPGAVLPKQCDCWGSLKSSANLLESLLKVQNIIPS